MKQQYRYGVCTRCYTFNQASYITDAMNGFAMQETSFPVVTLIVDDASTDGEQQVILDYLSRNFDAPFREEETEYARIICANHRSNRKCQFVVLLLEYNHFSIGKPKIGYLSEWLNCSKYHALCEGDDWWLTSNKLQRQYDALEQNPDVDMCACGTVCFKEGNEMMRMCPSKDTRLLTAEETILGGGGFLGTNSLFFRESLSNDKYLFPKYLCLDYMYQIHGSLRGGILYISDEMCAYRISSNGSWVKSMMASPKKYFKHREEVITALNLLDFETSGRYNAVIQKVKSNIYINQLLSGLQGGIYAKSFKVRLKILLLSIYNLFK